MHHVLSQSASYWRAATHPSILEGKIISKSAFPYIENHIFATVDIDTIEDLEYAKYVLKFKTK